MCQCLNAISNRTAITLIFFPFLPHPSENITNSHDMFTAGAPMPG